ncbi:MAG: acetylglutamate kinase [Verrucomicrobia bacterium]|nr:acetylglutamate kinase [Verrucomicrobiota bacterium]MBV9275851.1 acetylglutamate kinase [Verrucomicrobiota bacterium]
MEKRIDTEKTESLIDALPFIQRFRGQTFVIKYGGAAMEDDHLVDRLLRDVVFLEAVGINPVLIHGGGKVITQRMREAGKVPRFINGLRVTDQESIVIVEGALDHTILPRIVETIRAFNGEAEGFSGRDVFLARRLPPIPDGKVMIDLGFVGEVVSLQLEQVREAIEREVIPVISPIARTEDGLLLNVNADLAAGAMAGALRASKMIYVSDVLGVMRDTKNPSSLIPRLDRESSTKLMEEGIIEGGMVPKVQSALSALEHGVSKVHFIDGRIPHALLAEIFTPQGIGTEILP